MFDIDIIIPCFRKSEDIDRTLASIVCQWKREYAHVTLVNDCCPLTDCNYQDLVDRYKDYIDIRVLTMSKNSGQGMARQFGVDNTSNDWFMFIDDDDMLGNGLALSRMIGAVESYKYELNEDDYFILDENGEKILREDCLEVAVVSAPLFEFSDYVSRPIESENRIFVMSKLYNRKFMEKHNIRFNEENTRYAEDYYYETILFYCLDHDKEYTPLYLNGDELFYLWYPSDSANRTDPDSSYIFASYAGHSGKNILKFIKNCRSVEWNEETEQDYLDKLIFNTVFSYYTLQTFIAHIRDTDYVSTQEDWERLRDGCRWLRNTFLVYRDKFSYIRIIKELIDVKENSDVMYTDPWYTFDKYINEEVEELNWSYDDLLNCKFTEKHEIVM